MNTQEDPSAPDRQRIVDAPEGGRNRNGDIVTDSTESTGQASAWESSGDLTPENADETGVDGYGSGPGVFESLHQSEADKPAP
jgi:hypothetical protein